MGTPRFDTVVVGGGIVGLATARALRARAGGSVVVLEAEAEVARHQSGRNSGVIHAGLYYRPGSAKARLCAAGREELYRYCEERGIEHRRCGKLVVATSEAERASLETLTERAIANGLEGIRRLGPEEIREIEPHAAGIAGIAVRETGVVDFAAVCRELAREHEENDGTLWTEARVAGVERRGDVLAIETARGALLCSRLINCAGLECDRVARLSGLDPEVRIVPFRGEYHDLVPDRRDLVRAAIYPVPDPRLPFLGVHFTRSIDGRVHAGPNAVPALKRQGYSWGEISARDLAELLRFPGAWRLWSRHWRAGLGEIRRSLSKRAFVVGLRRLVPEIRAEDLVPGTTGVRAQAVDRSGKLLDDVQIVAGERSVHVLNAPSPAATASLAIGRYVAALASEV
jgi:L-2-hydroxyglutarate oxidase